MIKIEKVKDVVVLFVEVFIIKIFMGGIAESIKTSNQQNTPTTSVMASPKNRRSKAKGGTRLSNWKRKSKDAAIRAFNAAKKALTRKSDEELEAEKQAKLKAEKEAKLKAEKEAKLKAENEANQEVGEKATLEEKPSKEEEKDKE